MCKCVFVCSCPASPAVRRSGAGRGYWDIEALPRRGFDVLVLGMHMPSGYLLSEFWV